MDSVSVKRDLHTMRTAILVCVLALLALVTGGCAELLYKHGLADPCDPSNVSRKWRARLEGVEAIDGDQGAVRTRLKLTYQSMAGTTVVARCGERPPLPGTALVMIASTGVRMPLTIEPGGEAPVRAGPSELAAEELRFEVDGQPLVFSTANIRLRASHVLSEADERARIAKAKADAERAATEARARAAEEGRAAAARADELKRLTAQRWVALGLGDWSGTCTDFDELRSGRCSDLESAVAKGKCEERRRVAIQKRYAFLLPNVWRSIRYDGRSKLLHLDTKPALDGDLSLDDCTDEPCIVDLISTLPLFVGGSKANLAEWRRRVAAALAPHAQRTRTITVPDSEVDPEAFEEGVRVDALVEIVAIQPVTTVGDWYDLRNTQVRIVGLRAYTGDLGWAKVLVKPAARALTCKE